MPADSARDVFINCPFDEDYQPTFRALVFTVVAAGFRPRCALEVADGSETRIDKLYRIIEQSRWGIHDLSRTELDATNNLPRFNMPLELGIFLGAKRFGGDGHSRKRALILDCQRYRFQMFISDLAGMDITSHDGDARCAVERTREWLVTNTRRKTIPMTAPLLASYDRFVSTLR